MYNIQFFDNIITKRIKKIDYNMMNIKVKIN